MNSPLRLFRVYSPMKPALVVLTWAHDTVEAIKAAREKKPALSRFSNLKAFQA